MTISRDQSDQEIDQLLRGLGARFGDDDEATAAALEAAIAHPCAHHTWDLWELWGDLAMARGNLRQFDAAIAAMEQAIAHGWWSEPDARADLAEWHLRAGRREVADALFELLRGEHPDDAYLCNSAGFAYAWVDDPGTAEGWLARGLKLALAEGDPEGILGQMAEERRRCLTALSRDPDADTLQSRAEAFRPSSRARQRPPGYDDEPPDHEDPADRSCDHCGYRPRRSTRRDLGDAIATGLGWPVGSDIVVGLRDGDVQPAVAWFPAHEWREAISRWPDLLEDMPAEHAQYCLAMEGKLKMLRVATTVTPSVAPLAIEEFLAHCADQDLAAGTAQARAAWALELHARGDALPWPPGRNESCWCGSGRKYKKCCGPAPAARADSK